MTAEEATATAAQKGAAKKNKEKPKDLVIPPKKPKLTKAERRALQEAQRAAKAGGKQQGKKQAKPAAPSNTKQKAAPKKTETEKEGTDKVDKDDKTVSLFSHLPPFRDVKSHPQEFSGVTLGQGHDDLHPAVLKLGLLYAQGEVRGGNARCRAMLHAFDSILTEYQPPADCKDIRQHLDHTVLKPSFNYWAQHCRPHSVSMGNAFTLLKSAVATLDRDVSGDDAVETLRETIEAYIRERIDYADQAIAEHASSKIANGDVILVYGHGEVIRVLLAKAHENQKQFRVVVVDSRPLLEGKQLLKELKEVGIECCYILLNSLCYVMKEVTKVFLGASALMSDGSVLSRVGTACVALMATSCSKPVLVCCETYKMSNRVQLESITANELGNPDCVASEELKDWRTTDNLKLLNLMYDLTPAEFVSGIITEMGILPPTSVAVLLREMNPEGRAS